MDNDFDSLSGGTAGTFVKWTDIGDTVDGVIVRFSIDGGRDFNGDPCPEIVVNPCTPKGDNHTVELTGDSPQVITCGQSNLRRQVEANPGRFLPDHRIKITYKADARSNNDRTYKEFDVKATSRPVRILGAVTDDDLDF